MRKNQLKNKIILGFFLTLFSFSSYSSSLSFMIKDDEVTESYLKIKNKSDPIYLYMYCNNFINDIQVNIEGINESNFMSKNIFESKVIFGKSFSKELWKVSYNEKGKIELSLRSEGIEFVRKLYNSGQILIDMKELENIKLFTVKNKVSLQSKLDDVFENCGIYF